jgi:hypothetical protein
VTPARSLTATLVLDGVDGPLAGTLLGEDGVARPFSGWMELAAAIEAWRAGSARDRPRARRGTPGAAPGEAGR